MKIIIELPKKLEEALNLFCQACETLLGEKRRNQEDCLLPVALQSEKEKPIQKEKPKTTELPSDEDFAKLPLPEMEKIMVNPKNLSAFRFRAFARCARHIYAEKVEGLAKSINPEGINGILKGKHKNQAAKFISSVINTNFPTEEKPNDDIAF